MKIITKIFNDNDEVLGKLESRSFLLHEENLYKIENIANTICENCGGDREYEVGEHDDIITKKCKECK